MVKSAAQPDAVGAHAALGLIAAAEEGVEIVERPFEVIKIAREYAVTGSEWII